MPTSNTGATPSRKYVKFTKEDIDVIEAIWPRSDVEKEETVPGVAIIR